MKPSPIGDPFGQIVPLNTVQCAEKQSRFTTKTWLSNKSTYGAEETGDAAGGSYDDLLLPFFGPRTHGVPTDPLQPKRAFEAYFLPDAYKGRSDYLLTTIIDAVVSGNSFVTSRCLPLLHHDNPQISWSTMKFDSTFVDYEPEQGVPRLLTYRSATFQDHMARRGIAFVVNHGFANTEGGRLDFFYKLAHMKHVLQETLDQEGLVQIVNCKNDYASISHGLHEAADRCDGDALRAHERGLMNFACVQKKDRGWLCLDEEIKAEMARNGVVPDTWITPPGMKAFTALEDASVEYSRAGNAVYDNLAKGESANDTFRGNAVFQCNDYHVDTGNVDINHFVRERVIGDYFILRDFAYGRMDSRDDPKLFRQWRHKTQVYSCDTDKWETYDMSLDLLKQAGIFDKSGNYSRKFNTYLEQLNEEAGKEAVTDDDREAMEKQAPCFIYKNPDRNAENTDHFKALTTGDDMDDWLQRLVDTNRFDPEYSKDENEGAPDGGPPGNAAPNGNGGDPNLGGNRGAEGLARAVHKDDVAVPLGGLGAMAGASNANWPVYDWVSTLLSSDGVDGVSAEKRADVAAAISNAADACTAAGSGPAQRRTASSYVQLMAALKEIHDESGHPDKDRRAIHALSASMAALSGAADGSVGDSEVADYCRTMFNTNPAMLNGASTAAAGSSMAARRIGATGALGAVEEGKGVFDELQKLYNSKEDVRISPPWSFLCARPFRKYRMGSAVLMAGGLDTGFTAHAHEDVQVGDDPIAHVHVTHFTGWFSSTILDTKRIAVAHDVFCMGYLGGEGTQFMGADEYNKGGPHPYQKMFGSPSSRNIFPMLAPWGYGNSLLDQSKFEGARVMNPIDLSGTHTSCQIDSAGQVKTCCMPYNDLNQEIWGWKGISNEQFGSKEAASEMSKFNPEPYVNLTCFQTMQKVMNPDGEKGYAFGAYIPNTDHFGPDHIGPGSRKSRLGGLHKMKTFNYDSLAMI